MDRAWWNVYRDDIAENFKGEKISSSKVLGVETEKTLNCKNSGMGAILFAFMRGAERIVLLGFDGQKTDGKHHWHGDHTNGLNNPKNYARWQGEMRQAAQQVSGIEVINASKNTAYDFWPRVDLKEALSTKTKPKPVFVNGMHGLGDSLHQRAVVRELLKHDLDIWVSTPFPEHYYDLPVKCVPKKSSLPPQAKNEWAKKDLFAQQSCPKDIETVRMHYNDKGDVKRHGSVLGAMSANAGVPVGDFRLEPKPEWLAAGHAVLNKLKPSKPVMFYRPLIERRQHKFCKTRNPEHRAYIELINSIRRKFYVISIADSTSEKIVCAGIQPDADFTDGSLSISEIYGLMARADLAFGPVSFATVLAQTFGTPAITIFGGYESSPSFAAGARYSPWLGIDPIKACMCLDARHRCDKRIDVPAAINKIESFVNEHIKS